MKASMQNLQTIGEMTLLTAGGWLVSLQEIEVGVRIISLIVPTVLSIMLYKHKKNKK